MSQAFPLLVSLINGTLFCVNFEMISVIEWVWVLKVEQDCNADWVVVEKY